MLASGKSQCLWQINWASVSESQCSHWDLLHVLLNIVHLEAAVCRSHAVTLHEAYRPAVRPEYFKRTLCICCIMMHEFSSKKVTLLFFGLAIDIPPLIASKSHLSPSVWRCSFGEVSCACASTALLQLSRIQLPCLRPENCIQTRAKCNKCSEAKAK